MNQSDTSSGKNTPSLIEVGIGVCEIGSAYDAGVAASKSALHYISRFPISVVLVYTSLPWNELDAALAGVHATFGDVPVIGTTTSGEISNGVPHSGVMIVVLASHYLKIYTAVGQNVSCDWKKAIEEALDSSEIHTVIDTSIDKAKERKRQGKRIFAMTFLPGNTRNTSSDAFQIVEYLKSRTLGQIPIFAGASADNWRMESNAVLNGRSAYKDSILLAIFETELSFGIAIGNGFTPSLIRMKVTSAEGNEVISIDGLPANEYVPLCLGKTAQELSSQHITLSTGCVFGTPDPMRQYSINVASYFTQRGGVRMTQPVAIGTELTLMTPIKENMIAAGSEAVRKALLRAVISKPAVVLSHYCALRPRIMGEVNSSAEIQEMYKIADQAPFAGFYSFGECGLSDDDVSRHNNASVSALVIGNTLSEQAQIAQENIRLNLELLAQAEKKFLGTVLQQTEEAFVVANMDRHFVYVNPAFTRLFGYEASEIIGTPIEILSPSMQPGNGGVSETIEHVESNQFFRGEVNRKAKDGRLIPVILNLNPLYDENKEMRGYIAAYEDNSEHKKFEDSLKREKEKFEILMQASGDGIHLIDIDGDVIDVNDKFCEMLGYSRQEMLKMNVSQWDAMFSPEELKVRLAENFKHGSMFETKHRRKDGSLIDVEISAKAINYNGKNVGWNASRDISERKLLTSIVLQSEKEYRHLLEMLPYGVLIHRDGKVLLGNHSAAKLFGVNNAEQLRGLNVIDLVHPDYRDFVINRVRNVIDGRKDSGTIEEKLVRMDGSVFDAEVASISVLFDGKQAALAVFNDITIRNVQNEELRLAASVYQHSSEGMLITDAENKIVAINSAFSNLTGYTEPEVLGKTPSILHSGKQSKEFYQKMWEQINVHGNWQGEIWNRRKDGSIFAEHLSINSVKNINGKVNRYVALFSDITDQKKKEELIWNQANFDILTKLPNRRLFLDRLEQEAKKTSRTGASLALLFIDLDRFKEVNDTLGHAKGDDLLIQASSRSSKCIRESDTISRLGGDEFAVIVPAFCEISTVDRIVQDIIIELSRPFDLGDDDKAYISASIGITLYPEDATSIDVLMQNADQAMYAAKLAGRNRFSYFTQSMQHEAQEKIFLVNDLRHALKRKELEVFYQPIIDVRSGLITKAEALLRWHHPVRGLISPSTFIPLAEESGLIMGIGEWVFHEAIKSIENWQKATGRLIQVSVNKSPIQFLRAESHPWLEWLANSSLPDGSITVEITEGLLLNDSTKVKDELLLFKNNGIEVSIDDFGTGFSALSYLNNFHIDYLKIDHSFIKEITTNASSRALTEAIIVMAHKLGIRTIAEGVETEAQRDQLIEFGCDYIQGFLYSYPIPTAEFEQLLKAGMAFFRNA